MLNISSYEFNEGEGGGWKNDKTPAQGEQGDSRNSSTSVVAVEPTTFTQSDQYAKALAVVVFEKLLAPWSE